jgi:hypothetical protein
VTVAPVKGFCFHETVAAAFLETGKRDAGSDCKVQVPAFLFKIQNGQPSVFAWVQTAGIRTFSRLGWRSDRAGLSLSRQYQALCADS